MGYHSVRRKNEGWEEVPGTQVEKHSLSEAIQDIVAGGYIGVSHTVKNFHQVFLLPLLKGLGLQQEEAQPNDDQTRELKVIGVGYGRTGTYSLSLALTELGFPTLHTMHMYESKEILDMWADRIFSPSIDSGEAILGTPDFDLVAQKGFQATTDLPMALYFEQIHERYPECKFILTRRDDSEVWFKSWDVLAKSITSPTRMGSTVLTNVANYMNYLRWLFAVINKDNDFLTTTFPLPDQDKEQAIASYEAHNRRVRETIPPHLLLEYNVKQGWEPLCTFLEIENCPTTPFPRTNSATSIQAQSIIGMIFPLTLILFAVFSACALTFQRITNKTVLEWLSYKLHELTTISSSTTPPRKAMSPRKGVKSA